jgi:hypothetical protein
MNLNLILNTGKFSDKKMKDKLVNIHPKQVVNRIGNIFITMFEVKYQYTTVRGNKKEGSKTFMFNSPSPERDMNKELEYYILDYNKENPSRELLNVKFLESSCLGYVEV